jgi:HAD superfamily hydrolase (TIGR01509 family)
VDSEAIGTEVLAGILATHGVAISAGEAHSLFKGQSIHDIRITVQNHSGVLMPEDWSAGYYEALLPALAKKVKPINDIKNVIDLLKLADVPFCVASQGPLEKTRTTLTTVGLWETFANRAFSAKAVARPKPAPNLFLHAAYACQATPARCAVIEDSVSGVKAGITAGMTVFAYCSPQEAQEMQNLGAIPFNDLTDLPTKLCLPTSAR